MRDLLGQPGGFEGLLARQEGSNGVNLSLADRRVTLREKLREINAMSRGKQLKGRITGDQEVLSREETLRILSEMTKQASRGGSLARTSH